MDKYQFSISNLYNILKKYQLPIILLIIVSIKQLLWTGIVPIWHFPDEQAHFAQVINVANFGILGGFNGNRAATSDQIAMSEIILDTFRDNKGQNKYTFHPEYNLTYTDSMQGLWEDVINQLSSFYSHEMDLNEATVYPFLYYFLASIFYKLFGSNLLINGVFATRLLGILISTVNVLVVWKLAKKIFTNKIYQLSFFIMVMFQPMFSFVGAGISSDILFNLIFTIFLYVCILLLEKITIKKILALATVLLLGSITKQQMLIAYIITFGLCIIKIKDIHQILLRYKKQSLIFGSILIISIILVVILGEFYRILGFITAGKYQGGFNNLSFIEHIKWSLSHTYREVLPWYWGIFKWLGVTLPRWAHRTMMSIIVLAVLGNVRFGFVIVKKWLTHKKIVLTNQKIIFLHFASLTYFVSLMMWDYYFRRAYGFSFGLQGRYYFPVITTHMIFIVFGWEYLFDFVKNKLKLTIKLTEMMITLLGIWWLILQFIGLFVVAKSYYDLNSIDNFIIEVSQYKPAIFKGDWWLVWLGLYLLSQIIILIILLKSLIYEKLSAKN